MIIPEYLKKGDSVMILSPAGKIAPAVVDKAVDTLLSWGLRPIVSNYALSEKGRYSSSKSNRLSDFVLALRNPEVKAILCTRGGYGAVHLLEGIPLREIADHPKWLIGYSDVTLLHSLFVKAGVVSLHAPMAKHLGELPEQASTAMLRQFLFGEIPSYRVNPHQLNRTGSGEGRLVGGNLAVMSGLRATPYDFDFKDAILFIEDIGEAPYKIDRMLYNLKLSGVFDQIKGLVVGHFTDCDQHASPDENVYNNIYQLTRDYDFPVSFGFPVGHEEDNLTLPEGMKSRLTVGHDSVTLEFIK
ncbi:MAG: LD-carboxypeptidase [Bacteroidales bacterium]